MLEIERLRQEFNRHTLEVRHLYDDVTASVEHYNAFAQTRNQQVAGNDTPENQSEGHQIESLQDEVSAQNGSIVELNEENEHPDSAEEVNRSLEPNRELKPVFDLRIKTALLALFGLLLLGLTFFAFAWFGVGLELKLKQDNSNGMDHYKASTQREIENLQNSLDAEIKHRRKTESELKLAQETLDELRRDKAEAEKALIRPGHASWISTTFIVLILLYFTMAVVGAFLSNGINTLNCLLLLSLSFVVGAWLAVPWYYVTLVVMCSVTFIKIFEENSSKS